MVARTPHRAVELTAHAAERSICGKCAAYGLLEVTGARARARHAEEDEGAGSAWSALGVRCRKCGHEWTIE
jgi:RNase P subunit RPR2